MTPFDEREPREDSCPLSKGGHPYQRGVTRVDAAVLRAKALTAHRIHVGRLAVGREDEESLEAEAGGILDAETAEDLHRIREIADAWLEANRKSS